MPKAVLGLVGMLLVHLLVYVCFQVKLLRWCLPLSMSILVFVVCKIFHYLPKCSTLPILLFFFIKTCLALQESLILCDCCIVNNMIIWPQMLYYLGF